MLFVALVKMKGKLTPSIVEAMKKACQSPPVGIKYRSVFCTLGQYDFVITFEAPDEKEAIKWSMPWAEFCDTQTMAAISFEETMKLLG